MKKVVSGNELKEKMKEAVNLLCDTVKSTLGPKGCNSIIDHSSFSPFITNDGVTIASNIESDDEVVNTILTLAKESSVKTNEKVGDGTTTTLVLLQSIFTLGMKSIENGMNPIFLKRQLDEMRDRIVLEIKKSSRLPSEEELLHIASLSANSKEIGKIIFDAYKYTGSKEAITIIETNQEETKLIYKKGYIIDSILASPYFLRNKQELTLSNSYVLLLNAYLDDIDVIADILNECLSKKRSLLLIAEDYSAEFIQQIVSLYLSDSLSICLLKTPEYGQNKLDIVEDLSILTSAKIIDTTDNITLDCIGHTSEVKINSEQTLFSFTSNKKIENRIKELEGAPSSFENEFVQKRISMFQNGLVEIHVGAKTQTECRELKMRYDDALCAIASSKNGVVPGSGLLLYKLSQNLEDNNEVESIIKETLKAPFYQIMYNAGVDGNKIIEEIKKEKYKRIYNVITDYYEDIDHTEVIDPAEVVINSVTNAISIAGMLLTTTSLVINEYQNNLNKISEYNEI